MTHQIFHTLWTKAVGTTGYNKREWLQLEAEIIALHSALEECRNIIRMRDVRAGEDHAATMALLDRADKALQAVESR